MKKFLVSLGLSVLAYVAMILLNAYILKIEIPDFTMGWLCCIIFIYTFNFNDNSANERE